MLNIQGVHSAIYATVPVKFSFRRINDAGEIEMKVKKITLHKEWDATTFRNDIAIIHLEQDVISDDYIGAACLPEAEDELSEDTLCYITGG